MKFRQTACVFSALMLVGGGVAVAHPETGEYSKVESDLTGYWQQDDGQVVHFTQDGSSLTSRYIKPSAHDEENDLDFTATVHGKLVYGAHRGPFSRAMQRKCALQIWVGMGLTLSDDGGELAGFRGDRIVDVKTCSIANSEAVKLVYKRLADFDPMQ